MGALEDDTSQFVSLRSNQQFNLKNLSVDTPYFDSFI